jgi:hypothetical protein
MKPNQLVLHRETFAVYSQNTLKKKEKKTTKMIYGQSAEFVNFRTVATSRLLTTEPRKLTAEIRTICRL